MQIEINESEYCKLQIHCEADLNEINSKQSDVLDIFKKAPVPGFRKGKADLKAIKHHYKSQIQDSLKRALAEQAFHDAIFEKNIKPIGTPDFTSLILHDSKFECDFKLHVKPDFALGTYKEIEVPNPPLRTVDEVTEQILQQLRVQHGDSMPYEENDFVQSGDNIIINYSALVDGVKLDSLCADGELFKVGTSNIKDFDDNLLGMQAGEERQFDLVASENSLPSVAGKTISFTVSVVAGSRISPAPLDDTLAAKLGQPSFDELRKAVTAAASGRLNAERKSAVIQCISAKIVESHDIQIPNWLSLPEAQHIAHTGGLSWDSIPDADKERFLTMGANNVKLSLILDKVREEEPDAQLHDKEIVSMIRENLTRAGKNPDESFKELAQNGYLQSLFVRIRDEHVLSFLADNAKIID